MKPHKMLDRLIDEMSDQSLLAFSEGYNTTRSNPERPDRDASGRVPYPSKLLSRLFQIAGEKPPADMDLTKPKAAVMPEAVESLIRRAKHRYPNKEGRK